MNVNAEVTAAELFERSSDGRRCELIAGNLRMMSPSGWKHGAVVGNLHSLLGHYIRTKRLGRVFGAETGFLLSRDPDTVRAPDLAFIAARNLPDQDPAEAYWPGAPDLVVEVLSPSDTPAHVDEKIAAWLAAGAALVWVLDPARRSVTIYRSMTDFTARRAGTKLDGETVVPGFVCEVDELYDLSDGSDGLD